MHAFLVSHLRLPAMRGGSNILTYVYARLYNQEYIRYNSVKKICNTYVHSYNYDIQVNTWCADHCFKIYQRSLVNSWKGIDIIQWCNNLHGWLGSDHWSGRNDISLFSYFTLVTTAVTNYNQLCSYMYVYVCKSVKNWKGK